MHRSQRANIGNDTIEVLQRRAYTNRHGTRVDLAATIDTSVAGTRLVRPGGWDAVLRSAAAKEQQPRPAKIEVTDETTLAAIRRLMDDGAGPVAALNFASARKPGGGFLSGSQAQEESLARSSALYASLTALAACGYYLANRATPDVRYTDHAILSPGVPIFRDDDGRLLDAPHTATFITMPAVNVGAMKAGSPYRAAVPAIMQRRVDGVLALAASAGCPAIVLGAWGCGVFRNDPRTIATLFARSLAPDQPARRWFTRVVFAVFDTSADGRVRVPFEAIG